MVTIRNGIFFGKGDEGLKFDLAVGDLNFNNCVVVPLKYLTKKEWKRYAKLSGWKPIVVEER